MVDVKDSSLPKSLVKNLLETGQRSFIAAPFFDEGRPVAAVAVVMATAARKWSPDEVALVEAVAVQVRGAAEFARGRRRDLEGRLRQRAFFRDVLAGVTDGKLILCDNVSDIPPLLPTTTSPIPLGQRRGLSRLRHAAFDAAEACGLSMATRHDLVTAVGEAAMNAIVHGCGGSGRVSYDVETATVRVRIEDRGDGIRMEDLPRATLARGYSTKESLGHGFKMMLQTADRIYLLTVPRGR